MPPFLVSWDPRYSINVQQFTSRVFNIQHCFGEDIFLDLDDTHSRPKVCHDLRKARIIWNGDHEFSRHLILYLRATDLLSITNRLGTDPKYGLTYEECKALTIPGPKHRDCKICETRLTRLDRVFARRLPKIEEVEEVEEGEEQDEDSDATITPYDKS